MQRFAAGLAPDDLARLRQIVMEWIEPGEAARVSAPLHYNLPEHVQALAIRLRGSLPIRESLPVLRRLEADDIFAGDDAGLCRAALQQSITELSELG